MAGQWLLHTCFIYQVEIELDDDDNAETRATTSLGSASLAPTGTRAPSRYPDVVLPVMLMRSMSMITMHIARNMI